MIRAVKRKLFLDDSRENCRLLCGAFSFSQMQLLEAEISECPHSWNNKSVIFPSLMRIPALFWGKMSPCPEQDT
eukprot:scaffold5977_cov98-Cylindrotheca_fusiformis.AAC.6